MKAINIKSGSGSIVGSGVIIPFDEDEIVVSFQLPDPSAEIYDIDISFKFITDSSRGPSFELTDPWQAMDMDDIDRIAEYSVSIYNCDQSNVVSNQEPIMLGDFSGLNLYLNFVAKNETPDGKKVIYYAVYTSFAS